MILLQRKVPWAHSDLPFITLTLSPLRPNSLNQKKGLCMHCPSIFLHFRRTMPNYLSKLDLLPWSHSSKRTTYRSLPPLPSVQQQGLLFISVFCGPLLLVAPQPSLDRAVLLLLSVALLAEDDVAMPCLGLWVPLLPVEWLLTAQTPPSLDRCCRKPGAGAVSGGVAGTRGLSSVWE